MSLNIAITKLRAALGDSADSPRFVETLPRRGYRFIAPVTLGTGHERIPLSRNTGAAQVQSPPTQTDTPPAVSGSGRGAAEQGPLSDPGRRSLSIGVLSVAAVAAALFAGIWVAGQPRTSGPPRVESLAVLPLEKLSGDADQEFLADAVTDALITELGKMDAVRVVSRTSIVRYKGVRKALPDIGRELRVDAVVEGASYVPATASGSPPSWFTRPLTATCGRRLSNVTCTTSWHQPREGPRLLPASD